ncbi:hypothetical protein BCR32DRAFT_267369 [Anaeromyces robustus]|uniref:Elongin-A n=1 Tax=Anaeromyces robustus TaxID=1754192 RepID=A0A1Y1XBM1_9FUNG|nr:hypothetical protein BCR32DRAFT_267369 [Anaeromyces robustus]|eukprot:ORX82816.1 hypothetical protein BCR32DRAFT_267369 [Anaeromyces robustus]
MSLYTKRTVQSLSKLCLKKLENNPNLIIKPLKNIPYFLLESVVKRCTPEQLLKFEKFNKSYRSETQDLWKFHCKERFTDIRNEIDEGKLDEVEDWRDLYWKRQKTEDARLERIKEKMKLSYSKLEKTKQKKSIKLSENLRPQRANRSSFSSTYSSSSGSSMKVKRNATLMQKARAIAKRSSANFDFPIQNHSISSGSGIRSATRSPISRSPVSRSPVLTSSASRHGKSLSSLKSKLSSKTTSSSDIMLKRKPVSSSVGDNKRQKTEKKINTSSWDASSSFFSNF